LYVLVQVNTLIVRNEQIQQI